MIKHPTKNIAVHTWDWREQPEWESISSKVNEFQLNSNLGIGMNYVETGCDEHCIVIYSLAVPKEIIDNAYSQRFDWEEGKVPESLDWKKAKDHLNEIRTAYTEIGMPGMLALRTSINPLFVRFSNGERTANLYNSIMELK